MIEELVQDLVRFENELEDWSEEMILQIDAIESGSRAERLMALARKCVETCREAFGEVHREFER